jgi:choline-glycine betaine transporter
MTEIVNLFQSLNQEQAVVALFCAILIFSVVTIGVVAGIRSLGKWGTFAACIALAAVLIAYRVIR